VSDAHRARLHRALGHIAIVSRFCFSARRGVTDWSPRCSVVPLMATRKRIGSSREICVSTPLDAIMQLEHREIGTVVLVGEYANTELAEALRQLYPWLRIEREVTDVAIR
jgi:hypothetical protein